MTQGVAPNGDLITTLMDYWPLLTALVVWIMHVTRIEWRVRVNENRIRKLEEWKERRQENGSNG